MKRTGGFTLVEMLVTLALVGVAASISLPLLSIVQTRAKETELRRSLRVIRQALDDYKQASDSGLIDKKTGASGYPPNLQVLVHGVPRSATFGFNSVPFVVLRAIPRDPFATDINVPAEQTWNLRSYGEPPGKFGGTKDVFDVGSKSDQIALDGTKYGDW